MPKIGKRKDLIGNEGAAKIQELSRVQRKNESALSALQGDQTFAHLIIGSRELRKSDVRVTRDLDASDVPKGQGLGQSLQ